MVRISPQLSVAALLLISLGGCGGDNIGRLFDPDFVPGGASAIAIVSPGGDAVAGRPRLDSAFPTGSGWPESVPIVVVFNESMNTDLMVPAMGDPLVYIRLEGTDAPLPSVYDFLSGGRVVLMRPVAPLTGVPGTSYEIVVDPMTRDIDGVSFGGTDPVVVGTFTTDEDPLIDDGRILAVLPENNADDARREATVLLVFTKQADGGAVTPTNLTLDTAGGVPVVGAVDQPLVNPPPVPGNDGRLARFIPATSLDAATDYEVTVDDTITFGAGVLDFGNSTPFSSFSTVSVEAAVSVSVGNPEPGFPDQINTTNLETLLIDVDVPASAAVGDTIVVRIYGLDPDTPDPDDVDFVERSAALTLAGAQTATLDFTGQLGIVANPKFGDGPVTLAVQTRRGAERSGFVLDAGNSRLDVTPPTLTEVGPPMSGDDIITDLEHLAFYGTASEEVGAASLTAGGPPVNLFASSADGRFVMEALTLGRLTAPLGYSLTLTDRSGNMTVAALTGNILQRGAVTGAQAGTLTVEVYDESTLQVIPGATVVLDPGVPVVPAVGQLTATTDATGRAVFAGLVDPSYTVTAVNSSHNLRTLYDTGAAFVSLPLRPFSLNTASLSGSALFVALPGQSALVGCNVIDNVLNEEIATSPTSPTSIPGTAIRPNRPLVLTAFGGTFEPNANPTFSFQACSLCGIDGITATPPEPPVAPGDSTSETFGLLQSVTPPPPVLLASYNKDFASSLGLGAIVGTPTVRVVTGLQGFSGQTLMGVGFALLNAGTDYIIDASYSPILPTPSVLDTYAPATFVSAEAADAAGNVARHRAFLDPAAGTITDPLATPGIPTITVPGGPFTDAPLVDYQDRLDRDLVAFGFGISELTATDAGGRDWVLVVEDVGTVGAASVQFPDLSAIGAPGRLINGNWSIRAEDYLYLSTTFGLGDFLAEERLRQQVAYARAAAQIFVVN